VAAEPHAKAAVAKHHEPCTRAGVAIAQANERLVRTLIDLSSAVALEAIQTNADLYSAFVDAVRTVPRPGLRSIEALAEFGRNPLGWYDKQIVGAANAAEHTAKFIETEAGILAKAFERLRAETGKASKDIRETVTSCIDRITDIPGWNGSKPASTAS